MKEINTKLYFITDSTNYNEEEFLFRVEEGLKGGATLLQLREKDKTTREYILLAEKVHRITKKYTMFRLLLMTELMWHLAWMPKASM